MTKEKTAVGPWLFVPVLILAALSHGMLNQPFFAVKTMGNNAYWAFPIAALFFVTPAMAAIYLLAKRFPGQSLIEQGKIVLGPVFGSITGLIYLGFLLVFLAMLTRDIINFANVYFLFRTPAFVLVLVYLVSAAYLASRGFETIARTASMVVIPALIFILFLTPAAFENIVPHNLMPVFTPNLWDYFKGAKGGIQNFYMLGIAAMVLPFLKPLNSFPRFAGGTLLLLLVLFLLFVIGCIGTMGPEFLLHMAYPNFEFFHTSNLPMFEQSGIIIGITWIVMILLATSFGHYSLSLGFSQIIRCWNYKQWVWILIPVKFLIIMLPPGVIQTKMVVSLIAQNGWIFFFAYPFVLWILALVFRKKVVSSDAA